MRGTTRKMKAQRDRGPGVEPRPVPEAIETLKAMAEPRKFDQTVELALHLGIDPKQADQALRGSMSLPKGTGKTKRVIAFCEGEIAEQAKQAGAIEAGGDELIAKIEGGWLEFDVAIAHPQIMRKVGKLGRTLGTRGLMPSPKNGTVTPEVVEAVRKNASGSEVFYRNDDGGNLHVVVGKLSFSADDLRENIEAFVAHVRRIKPPAAKGQYIKRACIAATMSPSVTLALSA